MCGGGLIIGLGCTFRSSSAATNGGAVSLTGGSAEFHNCIFEGNTADNGGALQFEGSASVLVTGGHVTTNDAVHCGNRTRDVQAPKNICEASNSKLTS